MDTQLRRALLEPDMYWKYRGDCWEEKIATQLNIEPDDVVGGVDELVEEGLLRKYEQLYVTTTKETQQTVIKNLSWDRTVAGAKALRSMKKIENAANAVAWKPVKKALTAAVRDLDADTQALFAWFVETSPPTPRQADIVEATGMSLVEVRTSLKPLQHVGLIEHVRGDGKWMTPMQYYRLTENAHTLMKPYIKRAAVDGVSPLSYF